MRYFENDLISLTVALKSHDVPRARSAVADPAHRHAIRVFLRCNTVQQPGLMGTGLNAQVMFPDTNYERCGTKCQR